MTLYISLGICLINAFKFIFDLIFWSNSLDKFLPSFQLIVVPFVGQNSIIILVIQKQYLWSPQAQYQYLNLIMTLSLSLIPNMNMTLSSLKADFVFFHLYALVFISSYVYVRFINLISRCTWSMAVACSINWLHAMSYQPS